VGNIAGNSVSNTYRSKLYKLSTKTEWDKLDHDVITELPDSGGVISQRTPRPEVDILNTVSVSDSNVVLTAPFNA